MTTTVKTKLASARGAFSVGISRKLTLLVGTVVAALLLVGGASLALAARIQRHNDAVSREYDVILRLDRVHSAFDDLIFELHQVDFTGTQGREPSLTFLQEEIVRQLEAFTAARREHADETEQERESTVLGNLRRLSEEARTITLRLAAGGGRLTESELGWLDRATHEVPRHTEELAAPHHARVSGLLDASRQLIEIIVALYVSFVVTGGSLVVLAGVAAHRSIAAPLRQLAEAARGIAEGRFDNRVRVRSDNEIGVLSQAFNSMAARLEHDVGELNRAQDVLRTRVREAQALYRIGMEISRLHQLDRILQSIVEQARELLTADAVALCVFTGEPVRVATRATSGPPEAFRTAADSTWCEPVPADGATSSARPPAAIRPEYARAHLGAPLRLGDQDVGAIHVTAREAREFTLDETDLLTGLAAQAAIAIERARLADELQRVAAVEERERLAREMHDGIAQALGLLHLKLQGALARASSLPAVAEELRTMLAITDRAYEEVRQSIYGLRVFVSRGLGLVPTLTEYLHEFSAHTGLPVELETGDAPLAAISPASEIQAVRIIQEALTNVWKHARADRARVRLERDGAWFRVTVEDNGVGWDPSASRNGYHFGLQTMRERAEGVGGRLDIATTPGRGACIVASLPWGD